MAESRTVDEERAYIENLLNTRFNYYIVFVSLLLVPIAGDNPLTQTGRIFLLGLGAFVSALMVYMVVRTKLLLDALLDELEPNHPYKIACARVKKRRWLFQINANDVMVLLVFLIMLFFLAGATVAGVSPGTFLKTENAALAVGNSG
ncbi:MAG: hypothetical protein QOD42_2847 [Sphingomonadales bacterium]|jgi:hypothetical protein|nr:hypothetical protein [Sphingomonadales bacterium]